MAVQICFGICLLLTTAFAATQVQLVRSALDNDTALIGEPAVFTCSITNGMLLEWSWIDERGSEKIQTYVPQNHRVCGQRERYMQGVITTAEIHSVLAVVVNTSDGTANCTSLLEVKPIAGFSSVNISCAGQFRNGSGTTVDEQILPLSAGSANVLLLTSSIKDGIISTNESATFTCRVSAKSLRWSYKRNDMSTPVNIVTHNSTDPLCDDKSQHPGIINHTSIFSLLATNDNAGNIISILEITHRSAFTRVIVYCTATALDGTMVEKNTIFDVSGFAEPTMTQPARTTQDQATSSRETREPTTACTTMTTQETSGGYLALAAVLGFIFGVIVGAALVGSCIKSKCCTNNREATDPAVHNPMCIDEAKDDKVHGNCEDKIKDNEDSKL